MREIEGFEYVNLINSIEGINFSDFKNICMLKEGKSYKNYTLKMKLCVLDSMDTNGLFLFDSTSNKRIMVECVKKYYKFNENTQTCHSIVESLNKMNKLENTTISCDNCHLCALQANKINKLKKIN